MGRVRRRSQSLVNALIEARTGRRLPFVQDGIEKGPELATFDRIHGDLNIGRELDDHQRRALIGLLKDLLENRDVRERFYRMPRGRPKSGAAGERPIDAYVIALDVELRCSRHGDVKCMYKPVAEAWKLRERQVRRLRQAGLRVAKGWMQKFNRQELTEHVNAYRRLYLRDGPESEADRAAFGTLLVLTMAWSARK